VGFGVLIDLDERQSSFSVIKLLDVARSPVRGLAEVGCSAEQREVGTYTDDDSSLK
jgi:hypothetical protein